MSLLSGSLRLTDTVLKELREDEDRRALVDGISVRESGLDDGTARWLERAGLLTVAWVVNDVPA